MTILILVLLVSFFVCKFFLFLSALFSISAFTVIVVIAVVPFKLKVFVTPCVVFCLIEIHSMQD